jgi:hypothetical protein
VSETLSTVSPSAVGSPIHEKTESRIEVDNSAMSVANSYDLGSMIIEVQGPEKEEDSGNNDVRKISCSHRELW